jgi:hypothetical protein
VSSYGYPSSTTCSACGAVKAKLRLAERTYHCEQCGLVLDRDLNAARNLAPLVDEVSGRHVLPEFAWATVNEPDGNPHKTPHYAGSGYRHGTTHTNRCGSTSARQRADSGHVFTRFLNGFIAYQVKNEKRRRLVQRRRHQGTVTYDYMSLDAVPISPDSSGC